MAGQPASSKQHARKRAVPMPLGAGLHPATPELKDGRSYRLRLFGGEHLTATLAPGVSEKLVDECLATRRTVVLADGERGPVIIGALQTAPTPHVEAKSGVFEVEAEHIRLCAGATIALKVRAASVALERSVVARIEGEHMVIDVAALVRVLAAKVELP